MKEFKVYRHATQDVVVIKKGFSWPAFFFGPIWMLVNEFWWLASLWFGLYAVSPFIEEIAFQPPVSVIQILAFLLFFLIMFGLWFVPGFKGNEWREKFFSKRGYELQDLVEAETSSAAVSQLV
jgi:hypothetical protein